MPHLKTHCRHRRLIGLLFEMKTLNSSNLFCFWWIDKVYKFVNYANEVLEYDSGGKQIIHSTHVTPSLVQTEDSSSSSVSSCQKDRLAKLRLIGGH